MSSIPGDQSNVADEVLASWAPCPPGGKQESELEITEDSMHGRSYLVRDGGQKLRFISNQTKVVHSDQEARLLKFKRRGGRTAQVVVSDHPRDLPGISQRPRPLPGL